MHASLLDVKECVKPEPGVEPKRDLSFPVDGHMGEGGEDDFQVEAFPTRQWQVLVEMPL